GIEKAVRETARLETILAALRLLLEPATDGLAVSILKRRGGPVNKPVFVAMPQAGIARRTRRASPVLSLVHS
ncbi:MAG: hypothetical protein K0M46_05965, partial [Thiobacillus sp.]|nr:hypothetical protein [Thiobacillus sp.]